MANGKDTFELASEMIKGMTNRERKAKMNDVKLFRSQTRKFSISPLYRRYIGSTVTIAFNGNFKKFPVDGSQFNITEGHYNALMKYLHHVDRQIKIAQNNAKFMDQTVSGDFKKIV